LDGRSGNSSAMEIRALGYAGIAANNLADWSAFATGLLGMQAVETSRSSLALRMDDRRQRLVLDQTQTNVPFFFGWEVADRAALDALAARLETTGVAVKREPATVAAQRFVRELISFQDPAGNRLEVFHGPESADDIFRPGRNISGFRTGALGLGHAVLTVDRAETVMPFYRDVLGFRLSDYFLAPFVAYFFHVNGRHHSLALIETGRNGLHHLMVEMYSLDDVGQAYDIALAEENRIAVTLGRHSNDLMTSFYVKSPSDFMVECGWGGRDVDLATWQPVEHKHGPSLWGHERLWLPLEQRKMAKEMRMRAAAEGMRAPVQVIAGNHRVMSGACPWWDDHKRAAD
jgi:2,3-dihydroxybiphenyl 1,2-dioxygenase